MIKIVHTADWHLGQTFMQKSRKEEHQLFINWLIELIQTEQIDVVIIAGDIFDVANPSIEAMDLYHYFLLEAYKLSVEVVIIGGNHDSAARLNSTGQLLQFLHVHVVGGDASALGKIIPLKNKNGQIEAVIVAVPYLRDGDVRKINEGEEVIEAHHKFALSIQKHYDCLLLQAQQEFPNVQVIGTAHLYVNGSSLSDPLKEHMHAIGTLGQISTSNFSEGYSYIALGHIHKPQLLKHPKDVKVKYAGSPIALSFSERKDQKEITIIEIDHDQLNFSAVSIPVFRMLKRFKGNASKVIQQLSEINSATHLSVWGEIILTEKVNFIAFNEQIETICETNNIEILSRHLELHSEDQQSVREQYVLGVDNNPLDDIEQIFRIKCEKAGLDQDNIATIFPLFQSVLNHVKDFKAV